MQERFLAAYDDQLREAVEVHDAAEVQRMGPLWLARLFGNRGFITYRALPVNAVEIERLVGAALSYFRDDTDVTGVEWKTRQHDDAPRLTAALEACGFVAEEPESIMIGEAAALNVEVPLPDGVEIRRIASVEDVWAAAEMQGRVFDDPLWRTRAERTEQRMLADDGQEFWIATAGGEVISAGRLEPVPGTDFAGIWGGATVPQWRGRGIYRALTARRASVALSLGKSFIHSDSTDFSRPILERSGFVRVSSTTPYVWTR